jgi:hypothetical protein
MGVKGTRKDNTNDPQLLNCTVSITAHKKPDPDTHNALCKRGSKWLKKHSQNVLVPNCQIVAVELFTQVEKEIPDIIGWCGWCSVMIEVKVQRSDFLQDFKKPFRQICKDGVGEFRYYLSPENLIIEDELPDMWGLLYETKKGIKIIKKAEKQSSNLIAERNMLTSYIRKGEYII